MCCCHLAPDRPNRGSGCPDPDGRSLRRESVAMSCRRFCRRCRRRAERVPPVRYRRPTIGQGPPVTCSNGAAGGDRGRIRGSPEHPVAAALEADRKSTRLNSSHVAISYAVFCLKKKKDKESVKQLDSTV